MTMKTNPRVKSSATTTSIDTLKERTVGTLARITEHTQTNHL